MDFSKKRSNKEVGKVKLKSLVWYYHRCKDLGNIRRAEQIRIAITLLQRKRNKEAVEFLQKCEIPFEFGWFKKTGRTTKRNQPANSITRLSNMNKNIWPINTPMQD